MNEERDRLNREHARAVQELSVLSDARKDFIRSERQKIEDKADQTWGEQIRLAKEAVTETRKAREEEDARIQSLNPLVGLRVQKKKYGHYGMRFTDAGAEIGVLEVMTHETIVAANLRHSMPSVGDLFVRILKADGTPSKRVDRYNTNWKRIEEPAVIP